MTDQDKRAQLGEVLVGIEEKLTDMSHHTHRLESIGRQLRELGKGLESDPFLDDWDPISQERAWKALDRQEIQGLLSKAHELRKELERLEHTKQNLK